MSDPGLVKRGHKSYSLSSRTLSIYTLASCSFCQRAKVMLDDAGVKYEEHMLQKGDEKAQWVFENSGGRKVVPQLFVDDVHWGGFYEIKRHFQDGTLQLMLGPL